MKRMFFALLLSCFMSIASASSPPHIYADGHEDMPSTIWIAANRVNWSGVTHRSADGVTPFVFGSFENVELPIDGQYRDLYPYAFPYDPFYQNWYDSKAGWVDDSFSVDLHFDISPTGSNLVASIPTSAQMVGIEVRLAISPRYFLFNGALEPPPQVPLEATESRFLNQPITLRHTVEPFNTTFGVPGSTEFNYGIPVPAPTIHHFGTPSPLLPGWTLFTRDNLEDGNIYLRVTLKKPQRLVNNDNYRVRYLIDGAELRLTYRIPGSPSTQMVGTGTMTATLSAVRPIVATMTGRGTMTANLSARRNLPVLVMQGSGSMQPQISLKRGTVVQTFMQTEMRGRGVMTPTLARQAVRLSATMTGEGTMSANLRCVRPLSSRMEGVGFMSARLNAKRALAATMTGSGTMTANLSRVRPASATMTGAGLMTANLGRIGALSAQMTGVGTMTANLGRAAPLGELTMTGYGSMTANLAAVRPLSITMVGTGTMRGPDTPYPALSANLTTLAPLSRREYVPVYGNDDAVPAYNNREKVP